MSAFSAAAVLLLWLADSAGAAPPRHTVGQGSFSVPMPPTRGGLDKLVLGATLDLAPIKEILESRYARHATVSDFRQSGALILDASELPPTYARDFSVALRLRVEDAGARLALDSGPLVDARLAGRLVGRRLPGRGGCSDGEVGYGLAMVIYQSPRKVREEFGGFAVRLCVKRRTRSQCVVNTLLDGRVVEQCYPSASTEDFARHVCNAAYLDRQRRGLTVAGSVSCHLRWTDAAVRWQFDLLDGERPSSWYRGFIRRGMRVFGAVAVQLIAARYRSLWQRRFAAAHGAIVR